MQFLVSAGEASGDMYAAGVVEHLAHLFPEARFAGCAGPNLVRAGVEQVVDAAQLSVVGLAEVLAHLPRIYGEYRKLVRFARAHRPDAAILTDNPDFHLRLARHLKALKIPVFYLVAPQVWAWRQGRLKKIRILVDKLFCIFPFEEQWFRERGVDATYIGHPLTTLAKTSLNRDEIRHQRGLPRDRQTVVLLPGSRPGEALRHMPVLLDAVDRLQTRRKLSFVLATPAGFQKAGVFQNFQERIQALSIKVVEDRTRDCIGNADVALAASGTVTIEAAVLGTPMVTFYKVTPLSWMAGRRLVKVPFLTMVNLVAGREVVPELMQNEMTPEKVAGAAERVLVDAEAAGKMKQELAKVRAALSSEGDPLKRAAEEIAGRTGRVLETAGSRQETI